MESNVKLSIIVPVYNTEKHLRSCVDSIMSNNNQRQFEVLLIDDGSTDNSPDICDTLSVEYDKVIVLHKINGGLADARNAGLDIVRGEYVTFVDSDDIVGRDFIDVVLEHIDKSEELLVYSYQIDYLDHASTQKISLPDITMKAKDAISLMEEEGCFNVVWNKIYKRSVIETQPKTRFKVGYEPGEDLLFNCNYFRKIKSVCFRSNSFYHWIRRGEDTLANRFRKDLYEKNKFFIKNRIELYESLGMTGSAEKKKLYEGNIDYIFACIPNMYRGDENTFSRKERIDFYRKIMESSEIKTWVKCIEGKNTLI